jgi:predicted alpha/beta hydrolase
MPMLVSNQDNSSLALNEPLNIEITTTDHTKLAGTYYPCSNCSAAVLICSATGIGQKSYSDFAQWLNKEGFAVLTFDYRGTGDSLFGMCIKNSRAKKHEWGQLDMAAALTYLNERHADVPLQVVGHNGAGILMGLMPNHSLISSAVSVGESLLYVPQMAGIAQFIANLFFNVYIPWCLSLFGYVPLKFFGWGLDIPTGVAKQWTSWSLQPGHIRNSFGVEIKKHFYRNFRSPILVLSTGKDPIVGKTNTEDMSDLYRSARVEYKKIVPKNYGFRKIAHLEFFQPKYAKLWPIVSDWLKAPERQTIRTLALKMQVASGETVLTTHPIARPRAYAGTRTRLNAKHAVFIGASRKKVQVLTVTKMSSTN